jgi:hypothetical protein
VTTITALAINISGNSCNLSSVVSGVTNTNNTLGNFTVAPGLNVSTSSVNIIPFSGGCNTYGEFQIGPGQVQPVLIQISNINTAATTLWTLTPSISSRSM